MTATDISAITKPWPIEYKVYCTVSTWSLYVTDLILIENTAFVSLAL